MRLQSSWLLVLWFMLCARTPVSAADKESELARVAKDWCQVIRASQVMPVYPLTEDLFPGDIFLVQQTIEQQAKVWRKKGYLPLDNFVGRLKPNGYQAFYKDSFLAVGNDNGLPHLWLKPGEERIIANNANPTIPAWREAPRAAFPTYSFAIKKGGGFNAALPIHGIAIGLSLLGTEEGSGAVALSEARTYGVDINSLYRDICKWVEQPENRDFLRPYRPRGKHVNYLRVINRVYLVGALNVSVAAKKETARGLTAKIASPAELLFTPATPPAAGTAASTSPPANEKAAPAALPAKGNVTPASPAAPAAPSVNDQNATAVKAYQNNLVTLNDTLKSSAGPGAGVTIAAVSTRSVSLNEQFSRPLIIGYLGFDVPILPSGKLGYPLPTLAVINRQLIPEIAAGFDLFLSQTARLAESYVILTKESDAKAKGLVATLNKIPDQMPATYLCNIFIVDESLHLVARKSAGEIVPPVSSGKEFLKVTTLLADLSRSLEALKATQANANIEVTNYPSNMTRELYLQQQLTQNQGALDYIYHLLSLDEALDELAKYSDKP